MATFLVSYAAAHKDWAEWIAPRPEVPRLEDAMVAGQLQSVKADELHAGDRGRVQLCVERHGGDRS